jgi:hypothetical protein
MEIIFRPVTFSTSSHLTDQMVPCYFSQQGLPERLFDGLPMASQLVRGEMKEKLRPSEFTKAFPVNSYKSQHNLFLERKRKCG